MTGTSKEIKIAVSSCLLGNNVRYDGGNKIDLRIIDTFSPLVEFVPICPEVESGMPVPREPMQLIGEGKLSRLITIGTGKDRTDAFTVWITMKLKELEQAGISGFILKARSPSCGVHDTELFSREGRSIGRRAGLFAEAVMSRFPHLPVEDEETLRDQNVLEQFMKRIGVWL